MDQVFVIRMAMEEYLRKGNKMYAAFMELQAYGKVDRKALECFDNVWCGRGVIGWN